MKNHLFRILAYLIVLTFLLQPIQTLAYADQVEISDNSSMAAAQTPAPGEPYGEQFEKEFEMEIEAERQRLLEEHLREEGMPEELLNHEYGSNPQERPEYVPPSAEVIAQTKAQVDSFSCASVTDVPQIECEALVALYQSTNGAGWDDNTNWLITNTVDTWSGITVFSGHVYEIQKNFDHLNGSIPPELGNLTELGYLNLNYNQLNGSIPAELGNLSNLEKLSLFDNQLSGSIPPELGNLSNLVYVTLGGNQLSGSIPAELGNLSNLTGLSLDQNQLSGSIPAELGNLSNLQYLQLWYNQLSNSIPAELGYLSNLEVLNLRGNQLSGSIPAELGNLRNLIGLQLYQNQLSGSIPAELGNLSNLIGLKLYQNQLSGSIPAELGNLSNLQELWLNNNQLSGSIPPELGNLSNLQELWLNNNQLSGSIPPALGNLSHLAELFLNGNQLSGSIPAELGNLSKLKKLNLHYNQLSGSIPMSFINIIYLDYFYFYDTLLCEPDTPEFLAWKETVLYWEGTDVICASEPELTIYHVEWTQSVQDYENSVPLIAGKDTLVRVFVKSNNNVPIRSLSGTIVARKNDYVLDGSPMSWVIKNTFSGTVNFVLPKSWTTVGDLELTIKVNNSNPLIKNLKFETSPSIKIVYVPIEYDGNTADPTKMSNAISWMRDAYPNSNIIYKPGLFDMLWDPDPSCDKFILDKYVVACRALDLLNKLSRLYNLIYEQDFDFIIGWLPDEAKSVFTYSTGNINGISSPLWADMDGKSVWYGEWSIMGTGIAHELGHNLDQHHSNSANCAPNNIDPESDWPWLDSYIHDIGWRAGTKTFYGPSQYFDIMSYCDPQWISKHTYTEIYNYWKDFKEPQVVAQSTEDSLLVISGLVHLDDEATMDPVWERQISSPWVNPPVGTEYCVELIDSFDTVINHYCFDLDFIDYETQQTISTDSYFILLPDAPNISRVELKKGNLVLASRTVSSYPPQVELTSPNGGENWGSSGFETITWVGNDTDEDPLFYNVYYSPDNGVSWEPLAIDLETTNLEVDTDTIPGSSSAKIRVSVSDGVHSVSDESDSTFIVEPKGPQISIILQDENTDFLANRFVMLRGIGYDLEDGQFEGDDLCWSSDLDGDLGCGESITPFLSVGAHSITLQAIDSDGNIAVSTETINIVECFDINTYTSPLNAGKIIVDVSPNCSADPELYAKDSVINLNIEPNRGFSFIEWSEDINGTDLPKTISIDRDLLINARFEQTEFFINLPLILR